MRTKSQGMIKAKDGLTGEKTNRYVLRLYKKKLYSVWSVFTKVIVVIKNSQTLKTS